MGERVLALGFGVPRRTLVGAETLRGVATGAVGNGMIGARPRGVVGCDLAINPPNQ